MKISLPKKLLAAAAGSLLGIACAFPSFAANITGHLDSADSSTIIGWAWDSEDSDSAIEIELHSSSADSEKELKTVTISADQYREDLHESIKDGYHGFYHEMDWSQLEGTKFTITAFAVCDDEKTPLPGSLTYEKIVMVEPKTESKAEPKTETKTEVKAEPTAAASSKKEIGPGVTPASDSVNANSAKKGKSLGIFTTSGYCGCEICSSGNGLTYSGTEPQANHTISADITRFPIGTKLMINDIIYTVEDIGSSVTGNRLDIYYDTHEEALAHGVKQEEVFEVIEE